MRNLGKCGTLGELITILQRLQAEEGSDCEWSGWDGGSLMIKCRDGEVYIDTSRYDSPSKIRKGK